MRLVRAASLVSLGYEGRSVEELITVLKQESVKVLVDVRLTPLSRKPGMSKRRLEAALVDAGIGYLHLPALGNPRDNRDLFRSGDPVGHDRFRAVLDDESASRAVDHIAELLDGQVVAVLCFERTHEQCHRHLVAEAVRAAMPSLEVVKV